MSGDLQHRLDLMSRNHEFPEGLVERFGEWVRTADDSELFRIGVLQWAADHDVDEDGALDLFLHATKVGIMEMTWAVLCPSCGMMLTTPGGLRALGPDPVCRLCRVDFEAALDDQIEVTFSVEPGIRSLRYHDPKRISAKRDLFKIFFSPSFEITDKQHGLVESVIANAQILPGERTTFEIDATPGLYALTSPSVHAVSFVQAVEGGPETHTVEIHDGQCIPPKGEIGTGPVKVTFVNRTDYPTICVAHLFGPHKPEDFPPTVFRMKPFLSGKRMLTSQTFRDLFRTERVGDDGLRLKNLAILFTDLQASTALYERVGDLRALGLVREHFDKLHRVVGRHRGALVKTIGDAVMAVFPEPERALAAAAGMSRAVQKIDADGDMLRLKVGIHMGPCIAIQTNHQIDYFGSAVNTAARVQGVARGGETVVTNTIWNAPGVQGLAEDFGLDESSDVVELRGIAEPVVVHRLS